MALYDQYLNRSGSQPRFGIEPPGFGGGPVPGLSGGQVRGPFGINPPVQRPVIGTNPPVRKPNPLSNHSNDALWYTSRGLPVPKSDHSNDWMQSGGTGLDPNRGGGQIGANAMGLTPFGPASTGPVSTQTAGNPSNPYMNPNLKFGSDQNLYDTPLSREYGEQNPQSEWTRGSAMAGMGGNNRQGQFATNQFGKARQGFDASLLNNPFNTWRGWLDDTNAIGNMRNEWLGASAGQRGLNPASRTSGVRWG